MADANNIVKLAIDESECGRFIRLHFGTTFICELIPSDAVRYAQMIIDRANIMSFVPPMNFNPDRVRLPPDRPTKPAPDGGI